MTPPGACRRRLPTACAHLTHTLPRPRRPASPRSAAVPLVGTFAWIAPEILLGRAEVGTSADIFR